MEVDQGYGAWLKATNRSITAPGADTARWPSQGVSAASVSPFATVDGAQAEASRRSAFLGGPLVRDKATVGGTRRDVIGRCLRLIGPGTTEGGELVFVIGIDEQENGTTVLTVLRRLS